MNPVKSIYGHIFIIILILIATMSFTAVSDKPFNVSVDFNFAPDTTLTDTSHIDIIGNADALIPIMEKLRDIKSGKDTILSILHLGDSHIQGGYFGGTVRTHIQRDFGSAGRGFISPFKLMSSNGPEDYKIESRNNWSGSKCSQWEPPIEVGLSGVAISTADKNIGFSISASEPFSNIMVFHAANAPIIREDSALMIGSACDYESTETSTCLYLNNSVTTADIYADINDPSKSNATFYGFLLRNGNNGILYNEIGINGTSFTHINRSPQITANLSQLRSDLIIVSLGTNDAYARAFNKDDFYNQVKKTIRNIKTHNPQAVIMLTTPMEFRSRKKVNPNVKSVRETIIQVAEEFSLPYWDMYMATGGPGSVKRWTEKAMFRADQIHLTKEGYMLLGDMLYEAVIKLYNNNCTLTKNT